MAPDRRVDRETGQDQLARVRPRRGGFRTDPFAPAVDALELYDPEDGRATKAAIFFGRVIAPPPARLGAERAEDALATLHLALLEGPLLARRKDVQPQPARLGSSHST